MPLAAVGLVVSASFSVLAVQAGFTPLQSFVTSAIVFAGSAQFAALAVLTGGGGMTAALTAAGLMHSRFLAMGIALAPSLRGGMLRRALEGQTIVDPSWALAGRGDGTFDRALLFGSTLPQYSSWVIGAGAGALGGPLLGDIETLGLDALFPTFFVGILAIELRTSQGRLPAALGAAVALALVPFVPAGVPVLAASVAALVGLCAPPPPLAEQMQEEPWP